MSRAVFLTVLVVCAQAEAQKPNVSTEKSNVNHSTAYTRIDMRAPETVNVNTVLFKDSDLLKTCWSAEDIVLLAIRREMQGLIPNKVPENVATLLDYYKLSLESISLLESDEGFEKRLLVRAFADVVGGYLNHVGIPATNVAYYAGNIDYETAQNIHDLFDTVARFLKTTGQDWREPASYPLPRVPVQPVSLSFPQSQNACQELVIKPNSGGTADLLPIPMPYLDDEKNPNSLALPFRFRSLFSLGNGNTTNVLLQYYELGLGCLAQSYAERDLASFNGNVTSWIFKSVLPHLRRNKWYPGFRGVARIIETARQLDSNEIVLPTMHRSLFIKAVTERPSTESTNHEGGPSNTCENATLHIRSATLFWVFRGLQNTQFLHHLKRISTGSLVALALCCALVMLIPYILWSSLRSIKTDSQESLPPNGDEVELLQKLVTIYWTAKEKKKKKYFAPCDSDGSDDGDTWPKLKNFKNFWWRNKKVPEPGGAEALFHQEKSVHFEDQFSPVFSTRNF